MVSSSYLTLAPPKFTSKNYVIWVGKMKAYGKAFNLWLIVEIGREPNPLSANSTLALIKYHSKESTRKHKALLDSILCSR